MGHEEAPAPTAGVDDTLESGGRDGALRRERRLFSRRLRDWYRRVPAIAFGITFLMMIPIYALIYYFYIPGEFYHSTITSEPHYFDEVQAVDRDLLVAMTSDLQAAYGTDALLLDDGDLVCLDRLQNVDFAVSDMGYLQWALIAPVSTAPEGDLQQCTDAPATSVEVLNVSANLGGNISVVGLSTEGAPADNEWLVVTFASQASQDASSALFGPPVDDSHFRIGQDGIYYQFAIPETLADRVQGVINASRGDATGIPGEFARMVYLSAITTTTVGYGDIVPITARARLFAASESIVGVILVGFFLNSVAARRSRRIAEGEIRAG